jgi:hypothetical protein
VFSTPKEALPPAIRDHPGVSAAELPLERSGPDADSIELFRAVTDVVRFLRPDLEHARWPRTRAIRRVLYLAGVQKSRRAASGLAHAQLPREVCDRLGDTFRRVERQLPPEPALANAVEELDVDAMLVVTRCVLGGVDTDAVKVARHLTLPSVMLIWSWDNLSSKATLTEHPDLVLVWNEVQAREAVDQHAVPPERVAVTGAANFDGFFEELRDDGIAPGGSAGDGATILYLGSSKKVAPHERAVFERWLAAVRSSDDPLVRQARVVIRPHPADVDRWAGWSPADERVMLTVTAARIDPELLSSLLRDADAVVGLNTSAELEAAIAGRPVLTFRAGADAPGQEGSAHFAYLLEENGGFVVDSGTLEEHVGHLARALRGEFDRACLEDFVARFVRPRGLAQPVVPLVASRILEVAYRGGAPQPVQAQTTKTSA